MKWLLAPFSVLFFAIVFFRNLLFDYGIFKIKKFSTPIISIGNLSMGGTGKTPHSAYFLTKTLRFKKRVCVVSRGYGGHYGGYATRVDLEKDNAAHLYGDEPVYYAKNFSVPVYVAHDRCAAVELAIKDMQPEIIFSDDSFQHRWMGRHKDIVLLDCTEENLCLFPMGSLREPLSALKRAHFVILTK
ncbi:tetraacyldisaccharide 4'-kinase, partial [bacterium]|nr:tetraacyldisaccharide 4'-kinase [bacterium]